MKRQSDSQFMKNLTLHQLRIFRAVSKRLSFTAASRDVHLSQSAVSMQMQQLETAVGTPLFARAGPRFTLTEAGEKILEYCGRFDALLEEARESIESLSGPYSGTLKICAVGSAIYFAPSLLALFTLKHPGVKLQFLSTESVDEALLQMQRNEIDLSIIGRSVTDQNLVLQPFSKHPYVIIAAPKHPLARRRKIPIKELSNE